MRNLRAVSLFLFLAVALHAGAQKIFPPMEGETVDGRSVALPPQGSASFTIVAMAYGKKAEPLLEKWYAPAYARFVAKHGLFAGSYEVELFLVPVFTGLNKAGYAATMNRLRREVDPEIARRVLFVKDDARQVIHDLGLTDKDVPYFFVLDPQGRILERVSGAFSVEKLDALEAPMLN